MASGNLWQLFKNVTEQSSQQIATVLARNSNSYDVQVMGGGISVAVSDAAYDIGSKVFVRDGKIVSTAPNLPFVEIEV